MGLSIIKIRGKTMDDNSAEKREETIAELNAALAELEDGEGLSRFGDGMSVSVWVDESGAGYSILDGQGELVDSGDDWSGLVHRLESALPEGEESLAVIWP